MRKYLFLLFFIFPASCNHKETKVEKKFISVVSLIEKQVAHVDTSLYSIMQVIQTDSLHSDTTYMPREVFRTAAKDFLTIPDLSDKKVAKGYKEESLYDETLNRVVITYTPENPDKEEIQKQQLLVTPNAATGDIVNNIIINRVISNRDSFLQKNMLWQMDRSFQVTTISQKPGKPETTTTIRVIWNDNDPE
jgi:hypothetical protein